MDPPIDFKGHATAAVERTRRSLDRLRCRLAADRPTMSWLHAAKAGHILRGLDARHADVVDSVMAMHGGTSAALPWQWRRFLRVYDAYLEALRKARCELAADEYVDGITASMLRPAEAWQRQQQG